MLLMTKLKISESTKLDESDRLGCIITAVIQPTDALKEPLIRESANQMYDFQYKTGELPVNGDR
jgi:hypothetical protein